MRPDPDGPLPDPAGDGAPRAGTLAGLTASQYLAVVTDASPLCVVAGAGSGKTRVLTRRVARRVLDGSADAEHSVVVTFTRKAASELRRRLAHLGVDGVAVGTFHGIALAELRRHWADTGQMAPAVVDDPARILRQVAGNDASRAGSSGSRTGWPETAGRIRALASEIEWAQARGVDPAGYTAAARAAGRRAPLAPDAVADLYQRYVEAKARRHIVDLHDLVAAAAELIETDQVVADAVHWRVRHLYVDEFQDVNPAQWHLVRA
ncbi:MAG: UvrD-helicase domain-containing protein, partial [Actinomycetota bacterium]|nr:UvrD-helicase domain-containing protein [Actinomycetota bacterium]